MADGHIKISTKIDNEGAKQDFTELKDAIDEFGNESEEQLNQNLNKMISDFERLSNEYTKQLQKMSDAQSKLSEIGKIKAEIGEVEYNIEDQRAYSQELANAFKTGELSAQEYQKKLSEVNSFISDAKLKLQEFKGEMASIGDESKLSQAIKDAEISMQRLGIQTDGVRLKAQQQANTLRQSGTNTKALASATKTVDLGLKQTNRTAENLDKTLSKGVSKLGRYALALFSIRSVYGMLSRLSNQWLNSNDVGAQRTKAQIEAMTTALSSMLAPAIQWLVNLASTLLGYVNAVLKAFFGIELKTKGASKNTGGMAGDIKQANKELKKFTAGFDEIEKIPSMEEKLGTGGGGGGGGVETIQSSLPEPDISGFKDAFDKIKEAFQKIWDSDFMVQFRTNVGLAGGIFMQFVNSTKQIGLTVWDNLVLGWQEMMPNITQGFTNLNTLWGNALSDLNVATETWLPSITEKITSFINNIYETFRPLTTFISQLWKDFTQIMMDLWDEYGAPIVDSIGEAIDGTVEAFNRIWTEIVDPILKPVIAEMKRIWDEHLKDVVMEVGRFIGDLIQGALRIYNNVILPIIGWLTEKLAPIFKWVGEEVIPAAGKVIGDVIDGIGGVIGGLRRTLNGFITFLEGVFTGDWKKIWLGIQEIFGGIWEGLKSLAKVPLNWIIDGVNKMIRGLNKIKIPDWVPLVGGKGLSIREIPRLQRGGIVNRPMQAIIGDGGREAVIPLENDTRALEEIAMKLAQFGGSGGDSQIVIQIGNDTIYKAWLSEAKKKQSQGNGVVNLAF